MRGLQFVGKLQAGTAGKKQVRGPRIWAGVSGRQRGHATTQGICKCVCGSREQCICALTSELQSLPAGEEEGSWLSHALCKSYM